MNLFRLSEKFFLAPLSKEAQAGAQATRERVLAMNFMVLVSVGTLGYIAFLVNDITRGFSDPSYWAEIPGNSVAFFLILFLAFGRRLPFKLRAGGLMAALYLAAFFEKLFTGQENGLGSLLMLTCAPLMVIFFGSLGGWLASALMLGIMSLPLWMTVMGRANLTPVSPTSLILTTFVLILLALLLMLSVSVLMRRELK
jgi:hypothetical protein